MKGSQRKMSLKTNTKLCPEVTNPTVNMVVASVCCQFAVVWLVRVDEKMSGVKGKSAKELRLRRRFIFQQKENPKHSLRAPVEEFSTRHIHVRNVPVKVHPEI